MTLSPEQRLKAYRWAYENVSEFRRPDGGGICLWLDHWLGDKDLAYGAFPERVYGYFPEFAQFDPKLEHWSESWFQDNKNGRSERLTCLAFCIAMIETEYNL